MFLDYPKNVLQASGPIRKEVHVLRLLLDTDGDAAIVQPYRDQEDIVERQIVWHLCLLMMLTAALGGYLGGRYSRRLSARVMRAFVVTIGLGMAAYFFLRTP